jgi:hypothetical protein
MSAAIRATSPASPQGNRRCRRAVAADQPWPDSPRRGRRYLVPLRRLEPADRRPRRHLQPAARLRQSPRHSPTLTASSGWCLPTRGPTAPSATTCISPSPPARRSRTRASGGWWGLNPGPRLPREGRRPVSGAGDGRPDREHRHRVRALALPFFIDRRRPRGRRGRRHAPVANPDNLNPAASAGRPSGTMPRSPRQLYRTPVSGGRVAGLRSEFCLVTELWSDRGQPSAG